MPKKVADNSLVTSKYIVLVEDQGKWADITLTLPVLCVFHIHWSNAERWTLTCSTGKCSTIGVKNIFPSYRLQTTHLPVQITPLTILHQMIYSKLQ